jgi:hypothetical protein
MHREMEISSANGIHPEEKLSDMMSLREEGILRMHTKAMELMSLEHYQVDIFEIQRWATAMISKKGWRQELKFIFLTSV